MCATEIVYLCDAHTHSLSYSACPHPVPESDAYIFYVCFTFCTFRVRRCWCWWWWWQVVRWTKWISYIICNLCDTRQNTGYSHFDGGDFGIHREREIVICPTRDGWMGPRMTRQFIYPNWTLQRRNTTFISSSAYYTSPHYGTPQSQIIMHYKAFSKNKADWVSSFIRIIHSWPQTYAHSAQHGFCVRASGFDLTGRAALRPCGLVKMRKDRKIHQNIYFAFNVDAKLRHKFLFLSRLEWFVPQMLKSCPCRQTSSRLICAGSANSSRKKRRKEGKNRMLTSFRVIAENRNARRRRQAHEFWLLLMKRHEGGELSCALQRDGIYGIIILCILIIHSFIGTLGRPRHASPVNV